jgi:hypothetical protein
MCTNFLKEIKGLRRYVTFDEVLTPFTTILPISKALAKILVQSIHPKM